MDIHYVDRAVAGNQGPFLQPDAVGNSRSATAMADSPEKTAASFDRQYGIFGPNQEPRWETDQERGQRIRSEGMAPDGEPGYWEWAAELVEEWAEEGQIVYSSFQSFPG
jgi:hypothetical protein